jgi:putative ABC transport system permease protein
MMSDNRGNQTASVWQDRLGSSLLLAWRNLAHDRARFAVTMVGVTVAVILISVQIGLFFGFTSTTTAIIEHSRADLWVAVKGLRNFEITMPQRERHRFSILSVPGVERAEKLLVVFAPWHKPQGGYESVLIIGFDPDGGLAGPWNVVAGDLEALRQPDTVMVDDLNVAKLGVNRIGDTAEIFNHRARLAGFTHGLRSFTTSPYVFASFANAINYASVSDEQTNYVLVKLAAGADAKAVQAEIRRRLPDVDVLSRQEFADMTSDYWMFTTGAGSAVLVSAALGLIIGMVIVAQVLYATTIDHLAEFATLRAMGAPRSFVLKIIGWQAAISAVGGHAAGIVIAMLLAKASEGGTALIIVSPAMAAALFFVTFAMCGSAALVSVKKALSIDPAMVFQR